MNNEEWLLSEIQTLSTKSMKYEDRAFFSELKKLVQEQSERNKQLQGEIDGRLWQPSSWER